VLNQELAVRTAQLRVLQAQPKRSNAEERSRREAQLLRLRAQTAQARASFEAIRRLADLASLSITLQEKPKAVPAGTLDQDIRQTGREAWASFLSTSRVPLTILIYLLAYSPLWLPALWLWRRYAPPPRK
jgi:hypothetical protein